MKSRIKTRILALMLALSVILTLLPSALAAGEGDLSVTLDNTLSLEVGKSKQLSATVTLGGSAVDASLAWSSDNESVATVTNGIVEAVAAGSATITVTATYNPSSTGGGDSSTQPTDPNAPNTPSPTDDTGTNTITATATCKVTVSAATVTDITLNETTLTLDVGDSETLTATVTLSDGNTNGNVTWSSSNTSIATVDQNGVVTGVGKGGNATITATSKEDPSKSASCAVTVKYTPVTGVTLNRTGTVTLSIGGELSLIPTIAPTDASNPELEWDSTNKNVATVTGGLVKALAMGTTTITAKSVDNPSASAQVTIKVEYAGVTGISLDQSAVQIKVGEQRSVGVLLLPEGADLTNVEWSITGNNEIASISSTSGRSVIVTGAMAGIATLTARAVAWAGEGEGTASCTVTVSGVRATYKDEELREGEEIEIPLNGQVTLGTARYGDAPSGSPTWVSGSVGTAYFTNASSGVLVAQSLGTTEIKVTLGTYTATFIVRVVENNANAIPWSMSSDQNLEMSDLFSSLRTVYQEAREETGVTNVNRNDLYYLSNLSVATSQGVLYYNYVSPSNHGYGVGAIDSYYLDPGAGQRGLKDVTFVPNASFSGTAIIYYTGFDRNGWSFSGTIRVTVSGGRDVAYTTGQNTPVTFRGSDFNAVYRELTGRDIRYLTFDLPAASQGTLYYNYIANGQYANRVTSTDHYGLVITPLLDHVAFVPAQDFYGTVPIVYHITDTGGYSSTGRVTITVSNQSQGNTGDIDYPAVKGETVTFSAADFQTACLNALDESLDYIYFTPPDSSLGTLWYRYNSTATRSRVLESSRYYTTNSTTRPGIGGVYFVPTATTVGTVEIPFTAYSTGGHRFTGTVTINYGDVGEGDIPYTVRAGQALQFNAADFNEVILADAGETFSYITFDRLPTAAQGTLYYNYYSTSSTGSKVTVSTRCYRTGTTTSLSRVAFIPTVTYAGTVEIPFTAYSSAGSRVFSGTVVIEVQSASDLIVRYTVYSGQSVSFNPADFNTASQSATGGALNYVRFTLPATTQGRMYLNYDASKTSNTSVSASSTYYRTGSTRPIEQISFVPAANYTGTVEFSYTGTSTSGATFTGTVVITVTTPTAQNITYAINSVPLSLTASSFYRACSTVLPNGLSYIQFTSLPASSQGVLYVNYSASTPRTGTRVTTSARYYYSSAPGISQLVFVPRAGYSGQVSLGYSAYDDAGKRVTGTLIIGVSSQTSTTRFNDMTSYYSWAVPAVDFLSNAGIISGVGGGRFAPEQMVKRGDFTMMLCKALGLSFGGTASFPDVPASSYYAESIATAWSLGLITGSGGRFYPENTMTREDAMVLLRGALQAVGYSVPNASTSILSAYSDGSRVSSYAREAVAAMVQMGIISGYGDGTLGPQNNISRAEVAVILHKILTQ